MGVAIYILPCIPANLHHIPICNLKLFQLFQESILQAQQQPSAQVPSILLYINKSSFYSLQYCIKRTQRTHC